MPRRAPTGRPNGRPKGVKNKRTKFLEAVSTQAIAAGVTPLEVMLNNMRFYYNECGKLTLDLSKKLDALREDAEVLEDQAENIAEASRILARLSGNRMMAQQCAVEAASYCHPKLANIRVNGKVEHSGSVAVTDQMTPQEAAQAYLATLQDDPDVLDLVATEVSDEDLVRPERLPSLSNAR